MQFDKTIYDGELSDVNDTEAKLSQQDAQTVFDFFRQCSLFRWQDANNDCEDRANAACMLLDKWDIPSFKAWVFGGSAINKGTGTLTRRWKYHVAAALPVLENGAVSILVLDPATQVAPCPIAQWAHHITDSPYSFHFVKASDVYIFSNASLAPERWYRRNRQNYKWTIQGLAGINGVSKAGKAQLVFQKPLIAKTKAAFERLLQNKPASFSSLGAGAAAGR